jgi:DNA-directed RNA polymerase specialized sigma24 family protein
MSGDVSQTEWRLIQQCAKKEYKRLQASTNLSLEWFINAGYMGLIERRKHIKRENTRYVFLAILSGIRRELCIEFDRRKQRDGSYRTCLTFSDLEGSGTGHVDDDEDSGGYLDNVIARQSEWDKDQKDKELWDEVSNHITSTELECVKLWADGYTYDEAANLTGIPKSTVRYHRANAINKLKGAWA